MQPSKPTQINLCIEFGTSKIQVGYTCGNESDVKIVKGWEGGQKHLSNGTRTEPAWIENLVIIEGEKKFSFGRSKTGRGLPGSKHMIDGDESLELYKQLPEKCRQNSIDTRDLLIEVFRLSLHTATEHLDKAIDGPWEFKNVLFPVPAGWADDDEHSDQIQKLLQETDSVAGFQLGLDIIVEPEAVAAFVESHYRHKISQLLKNRPSVSILIADIGEGTCDYSLYNVQRINDNLIWLLAQKSRGFRGGIGIFWMKLQKRIDELPNAIEYESENSARTQVFNFEQSASDITVAGTTITKAEVDSYMSDAFDTPLQELRDLYEKSQPACTFVAGQAAASSRYLQSRMREKIGWDDSCVQILEPTQAMTAVIEGALRPEPTMNIEEQFENCFFGLIFIKSSKSPRRARRPRRKRRRKNVETAENLLLLKQPGERISSEWHEFIVNDRQREFRVIPGYTFEGSSMDNNYEPPIIPGEQAIIMDSIVFRLPSDTGKGTGKVDVRVSAVKDGDMVVEVRTPDRRIYSRTCYLDHCRGRIIIVAKPEKADSQIANQQVTPPGDDGETIAATPEHELTTRQLCLDEVMHTSDGRRASSESIYVTVDDSNSGGDEEDTMGSE